MNNSFTSTFLFLRYPKNPWPSSLPCDAAIILSLRTNPSHFNESDHSLEHHGYRSGEVNPPFRTEPAQSDSRRYSSQHGFQLGYQSHVGQHRNPRSLLAPTSYLSQRITLPPGSISHNP